VVLSVTVSPLKLLPVSAKPETGNSISERRLTSNTTLSGERRDIWRKKLKKSDKRSPTIAYAEIGSRNVAETA